MDVTALSPAPRAALKDPHAIIARMGEDVFSVLIEPVREGDLERRALLRFGWTAHQIDAWFESALMSGYRQLVEFTHA